MPVAMPQVVRRSLGEEAVVDFMPWMEKRLHESIREKAVPRDEYEVCTCRGVVVYCAQAKGVRDSGRS